jgi:hypothetical protein
MGWGARLGIDFGTTHTVAVLETADGRVEPLLFDSSPLLSSAVYASPDGRLLTGRDGERYARLDPTRYEPNPKRRVDEATILLGREYPVPQVIAAVLGRVVGEAVRVGGGIPTRTVLTYPATWGRQRKDVLARAAVLAGLDPVVLVPEPIAAAAHFADVLRHTVRPGETVAVYDLGAGTFDASVVRRRPGGSWEVAACEGLPDVGGLDLDAVLVGRVGATLAVRDPQLWSRLANPDSAADRRASLALWDEVRGAKEELSRTSSATVHVPLFEVDTHVTREEFDAAAYPLLSRTVEVTAGLLARTGRAGVYLVGGSSRIPLVATLLHQRLGVAPTLLDQPELVVALGSLRAVSAAPLPAPAVLEEAPRRPGRWRWALVAAALVALLVGAGAGGVAMWQTTGHHSPQQQLAAGATSAAAAATGDQRLTINKTVWYRGEKFTLTTATYHATAPIALRVEVSVENLGVEPDDSAANTTVYLAADGHITTGRVTGITSLPGGSTVKATLEFRPAQPIANLKSGVISVGASDTAQAVVPLADAARPTTLEPRRVGGTGQYTVGVLTFTVHYCELRGDFPATHKQAPTGSLLVVCGVDVKDNKNSIYDHGVWSTNFRLKLPDGSVVAPTMWTSLVLNYNQQATDKPVGFTIRWPAPGAYGFQVLDAGRLGNEPPPPNGLAELPLTLT